MMTRRKTLLAGGLVAIAIVLVVVLFVQNKPAKAPNTNLQTSTTQELGSDQINESIRRQQEELVMQPSINDEEFILTSSNVSCPANGVNGQINNNCSGNIHIVPKLNESSGEGLYKINDQTKLLHDGKEQSLTDLNELSQNQVVIRLTLATGSEEMLAEIRY